MKFYHIHCSTKKLDIENGFIENMALFFSKKNSDWFNIEKQLGKKGYGGYIIYEVNIPKILIEYDFKPKESPKIVKIIDVFNLDIYTELMSKSRKNLIEEMNKRNIIGIDATNLPNQVYSDDKYAHI